MRRRTYLVETLERNDLTRMAKLPIALQLYTVRDDAARDFTGTIAAVAGIGYGGVEIGGNTGGLSIRALKSLLDDHGLKIAGNHVGIDILEKELGRVIEDNLSLANHNVVVPWIAKERRQSAESYRQLAASLNEIGEAMRAHGLVLSYHNHDFEFAVLESGDIGLDVILQNTDPTLVKLELDTYWALVGGHNPVDFLKKHSGRISLVHIKDRDPGDGSFAEIGTGNLPLDEIVATAPSAGAAWLIVEQDVCKRPPLESARISYENLKARGYA
jgi:sugar phosphate isomerase/epimerase